MTRLTCWLLVLRKLRDRRQWRTTRCVGLGPATGDLQQEREANNTLPPIVDKATTAVGAEAFLVVALTEAVVDVLLLQGHIEFLLLARWPSRRRRRPLVGRK
jgi:hypothetical protein